MLPCSRARPAHENCDTSGTESWHKLLCATLEIMGNLEGPGSHQLQSHLQVPSADEQHGSAERRGEASFAGLAL